MLRLADWLIWDFWLAPRRSPADSFHLFFLQAPRDLPDPELRHDCATVGHADSHDLVDWTYRGTALEPGSPGSWDDLSIWTGSVIWDGSAWRMFYTGRNRAESGRVQRIGFVTSSDLSAWTRPESGPVLEADPAWYQQRDDHRGYASDCRDPWLIQHGDRWLLYFTTSDRLASRDQRGVVGLASSDDLIDWRHLGPVTASGHFGEVEVPQVFRAGNRWGMLFCTAEHSQARIDAGSKWFGSHCFISDSPLGTLDLCPGRPLLADDRGTHYGARLVDDPWMRPVLLAWRRLDAHGRFAGELTDPIPVDMRDGCLQLQHE